MTIFKKTGIKIMGSLRGKMISSAIFTLFLLVVLMPATGWGDAEAYETGTIIGGTLTTVNDGAGNQTDPHVDGDLAAYTSALSGVTQIRYFDFASSADLGIPTTGISFDFLSDVSGSTIVFTRIEPGKQSIWSFDTATASPAVELAPSATSSRRGAVIGNRTVAWQETGFSPGDLLDSEIVA